MRQSDKSVVSKGMQQSARGKMQKKPVRAFLYEDLGTAYPIMVIAVGVLCMFYSAFKYGNQLKLEPVYLVFFALYIAGDLIRLSFLGGATISLGFAVIFCALLVNYPRNSLLNPLLIATLGSLFSETLWSRNRSERRQTWRTTVRRACVYAGYLAVAGLVALLAYKFIVNGYASWFGLEMVHIQATLAYFGVYSVVSMLLVWPHDQRIRLFLTPDEEPLVRIDLLSTLMLLPIPASIFYLYHWVLGQTEKALIVIVIVVLPLVFVLLFYQALRFTEFEETSGRQSLRTRIDERLRSPAHMTELTKQNLYIMAGLIDFRWGAVYSLANRQLELRRYGIKLDGKTILLYDPRDTDVTEKPKEDAIDDQNAVIWPRQFKPGEGILDKMARLDHQPRFFYHGLTSDTPSELSLPRETALAVFPVSEAASQLIGLIALARPKHPFTTQDWDRGQLLSSESSSAFRRVRDLEHRALEIRRKLEGFASPRREMQEALQQLVAQGVEVNEFLESLSATELRENLQALLQSVIEEKADAGSLIPSDRVVEIYNQLLKKTAEPVMPPIEKVRDLLEMVTHSVPPAFFLYYQSSDMAQRPKAFWEFVLAALETRTVPDILARGPAIERTIKELKSSSLAGRDKIIEQLEQFREILEALRDVEDAAWETWVDRLANASQTLQLSIESAQTKLEDPERLVFVQLATTWRKVVTNAWYTARARRTRLAVALSSRRVLRLDEVKVQLGLENKGPGSVSRVVVRIRSSEDYSTRGEREIRIGRLPAGGTQKLEFDISPRSGRDTLTLMFLISYHNPEGQLVWDEFVDRVSLREELMPFRRVGNVYTVGPPLEAGSALFFGREDVFTFIHQHLAVPTKMKPVLLLTGVRRMGKTSILKQLSQRLRDQPFIPVFLDCQRMLGGEATDFFWWLCNGVTEGLRAAGLTVEGLAVDLSEHPQIFFENEFLPKVWERIGDRSLLVTIDEFEALHQLVQSGELTSAFVPYLRSLMQSETRMAFILVGSPRVLDLISSYESALFNLAQSKRVRFLRKDDALRLITQPVAPYDMVYDDLALDEILHLTAGHPYFLQLICACLVDYCNEKEHNYVTNQDVRDVLERIMEQASAHLQFVWAQSSSEEKAVLSAMISFWDTQEHITTTSIVEHLQESVGNLPETVDCDLLAVTKALERLIARDIVQASKAPGTRSRYEFTAHLYHEWVSKYKTLDRILPELCKEVS